MALGQNRSDPFLEFGTTESPAENARQAIDEFECHRKLKMSEEKSSQYSLRENQVVSDFELGPGS